MHPFMSAPNVQGIDEDIARTISGSRIQSGLVACVKAETGPAMFSSPIHRDGVHRQGYFQLEHLSAL